MKSKRIYRLLLLLPMLLAAYSSAQRVDQSPVAGITFRFIKTTELNMRIAEMGSGPMVLLAHGWPESWYSWRHQIKALAHAGYHVVAPDMRGYGETDAPPDVDDYNIQHLAGDMVGILDALDQETAIMVGHDWGAVVACNTVMLYPQRFTHLIVMSVPCSGRSAQPMMPGLRASFGDNFFYMLYHNEPGGVAEAEYDGDPRGLLSRLYLSPGSPRHAPTITDPKRSAGGWIGRLGAPKESPDWLKKDDLDYIVSQFENAGFRGGVNYYRNIDRNWEVTEELAGVKVAVPTLFIAGSKDVVIRGATVEALTNTMRSGVSDLKDVILIPEIGHWVQQEAPEQTNKAMLDFLKAG